MPILQPDLEIRFPGVTVLKASAGSGKTYTLTERYVQFLLSSAVPKNDLRNLLAMTFSNNATREMRESVLRWLKELHFRNADRLSEIAALTSSSQERVARRAGEMIEEILSRYTDFQVRTIDSFMSTVFRASALDFGFSPEFEILMDPDPLIDYAFSLFLREARQGGDRAALLDDTIGSILGFKGGEDAFPWDPVSPLLAELKKLDSKLSTLDGFPSMEEQRTRMRELQEMILDRLERIRRTIDASGLDESARSTFPDLLARARAGRFKDLIGRGMKSLPVKKTGVKDPVKQAAYAEIQEAWAEADSLVGRYAACWARAYYLPYLHLHAELSSTVERVKRSQARVFINDINRALSRYLTSDIVPDIYFRIGEKVSHFLIDEFQDTSPMQWRNLYPLVENSLATGGSLFVVGDTKQAIYGFREADYRIMKSLEASNPFASAGHSVLTMTTNWRSRPRVIEFASEAFGKNAIGRYPEAAGRSGLDNWHQEARPGTDPGYAEVEVFERDDEDPPERRKLHELLESLERRGYRWGDIAVLTPRNQDVIRATSWLNEKGIPFISSSSLDVRRRRAAGEILALLAFLDSPPDDLSFATFILGALFARALAVRMGWADTGPLREFFFRCRTERPLYKAFQREFPDLWKRWFAGLFRKTGYLPLYDLVSEAYAVFGIFELAAEEEATFAKLLETVREFEGSGLSSLRGYLGAAGSENDLEKWSIDVPHGADSVHAMTIHKAKGLGFTVAIVILYGEVHRGFEHTVWRDERGISLVKLTRQIADRDESLGALYEEESEKDRVNRLNALYVALTRARRELYVIAVKREKDSFPFDLLPVSSFPPSGSGEHAVAEREPREESAPLSHQVHPAAPSFGRDRLSREERRRGELVHRALSLVEYARDDLEDAIRRAADRAAMEARESAVEPATLAAMAGMIRNPELGRLFEKSPGRTVLVEQEFCDREGRLSRMDRVVVDPDAVTVIDYKTGSGNTAEHDEQIRAYARILSDVYPGRRVDGLLAFVDSGILRRVG